METRAKSETQTNARKGPYCIHGAPAVATRNAASVVFAQKAACCLMEAVAVLPLPAALAAALIAPQTKPWQEMWRMLKKNPSNACFSS